MPIFPLDRVANAPINSDVEVVLQGLREQVAGFPFSHGPLGLEVRDVLEVYDAARPGMNLLASLLCHLEGKSGADISTGFGFLPVLLSQYGLETIATEKNRQMSAFAEAQGIEVRSYELGREAPPFDHKSLDYVVFAEVLEHLRLSPLRVLKDLAELLRVGGYLVLTTPNVARRQHIEALVAGENFLEPFPEETADSADPMDLIEHVREYSVREAVEAVEGAGLGVEQVMMTGWGESGYELLPNPYANEIIVVLARK